MDVQTLWQSQLEELLEDFAKQVAFKPGQLFVVGCSTSEIVGQRIGSAGGLEVAESLFGPLRVFAKKHDIYLAFQGCEHINRAITMERQTAQVFSLEPVSVIPVQKAGGSMSAYAYTHFTDPVVVEHVQAHGGIDIGQTLIGMQMKPVAVPIRTSIKQIGEAIVTLATTRPKLIGGERAIYNNK
ncbi:TIGR01440 family protein [Paenisporosarcina sp. TG20]|uniref:TIGR01440 family protein n=1 Tax=Paenisporosarcina sp. TG20 TaxID=1211706 RepID=UPI00031AE7EA|nr:TIGR01440 family protein [Paenisporosarcina sp. TG20]